MGAMFRVKLARGCDLITLHFLLYFCPIIGLFQQNFWLEVRLVGSSPKGVRNLLVKGDFFVPVPCFRFICVHAPDELGSGRVGRLLEVTHRLELQLLLSIVRKTEQL